MDSSTRTLQLFDAAKKHSGITSDRQLALRIGISAPRMSQYRSGAHECDDDSVILRAATLAGRNPEATLAEFRAQKFQGTQAGVAWSRIAEKLRRYGVAALLISVQASALSHPLLQGKHAAVASLHYILCEVVLLTAGATFAAAHRHFWISLKRSARLHGLR